MLLGVKCTKSLQFYLFKIFTAIYKIFQNLMISLENLFKIAKTGGHWCKVVKKDGIWCKLIQKRESIDRRMVYTCQLECPRKNSGISIIIGFHR